jgi:hypothetical protein
VELNQDIFYLEDPTEGKIFTKYLPYVGFPSEINDSVQGITLKTYYPFSSNQLEWKKSPGNFPSSQYLLFNENISQDFVLSLNPKTQDFKSSLSMGKLNIHYLPTLLAECFKKNSPSKLIIWNMDSKKCFVPEEKGISIQSTKTKKRYLILPRSVSPKMVSFFPEFSPWPLDKKLQLDKASPFRILSKKLFEETPTLFLFGDKLSYFYNGKWEYREFDSTKQIELPWMGFTLKLLKHTENDLPVYTPFYEKPILEKGKVVSGDQKALSLEVNHESFWVTDNSPLSLAIGGKKYNLGLKKAELTLPFEFTLTKFKMDTNPGTMDPSSYESYIRLFKKDGPSNHHIYMNNPLKYDGFTFYQASFFKDEDQNYGTVLSVNADPGRPIKYLGAILVVLGSIGHFVLRSDYFFKNPKRTGAMT